MQTYTYVSKGKYLLRQLGDVLSSDPRLAERMMLMSTYEEFMIILMTYKYNVKIILMRGQVYELQGKKIFTFGGASSHDIDGGIPELDDPDFKKQKKALDKGWKPYRNKKYTEAISL